MKILLIDDDKNLAKVISYQLGKGGHEVIVADNGLEGIKYFKENLFEIVLSDIQMPDISGIEVLKQIRKLNDQVIIVMITAFASVDNAIQACSLGADDYLTKPFSHEQLMFVIEKTKRLKQLQHENRELKTELFQRFEFENFVSNSEKMASVLEMASRVAKHDSTVLLLGESGTGKGMLAKAIHLNSSRSAKPFIIVNCPAIPDNLIESELFGHVKGAFTGALNDRMGKFELADGGTLFLDEIGELKPDIQAKLLRVLQDKEIERLGAVKSIPVDVRIIAATNRRLEEMVAHRQFREDLYFRLSVFPIVLPPLKERKEDIPYLADMFMRRFSAKEKFSIEKDVLEKLVHYHWPGNIRELGNIIERALILARGNKITKNELPAYLVDHSGYTGNSSEISLDDQLMGLEEIEKKAIQQALNQTNGNQSKAAKLLKIPRHVLLYRLKKFGLK